MLNKITTGNLIGIGLFFLYIISIIVLSTAIEITCNPLFIYLIDTFVFALIIAVNQLYYYEEKSHFYEADKWYEKRPLKDMFY